MKVDYNTIHHEYTLLLPSMVPFQFMLLRNIFEQYGYRAVLLENESPAVVECGLKYVHNDTCYPALLVIGQMIDALNSGKYDLDRTALMITQTGGGCRASNYLSLLRKALARAGYGNIPVLSLNFSGLERGSSFRFTLPMLFKALAAILYGDIIMLLYNQTRPYETETGASLKLAEEWIEKLSALFVQHKAYQGRNIRKMFVEIARSFAQIPVKRTEKIKVGIVGEIYAKYSGLANNHLEDFLLSQNCEVMIPGLLGFVQHCVENAIDDHALYGGGYLKSVGARILSKYFDGFLQTMADTVSAYGFVGPSTFAHVRKLADGLIGHGNKMGEGWLLPAEMLDLVDLGYENIVCVQPFGCLPNHIIGKGMIRKIRATRENANIVPIDYDPGATRVNQENRLKLMLAVARENMQKQNSNA